MSADAATAATAIEAPEGGATKPDSALVSFTAALTRGDLQGASACFTREGCLITPDHTSVYGREDIAGVLAQLIAARTEIEIDRVVVRQAGEVALASGRVTMRSDGPEGTRFAQTCDPTMVIQKVEGTWKLAVIAPWGSR
jgi:ketosteroid isomerase-like protein